MDWERLRRLQAETTPGPWEWDALSDARRDSDLGCRADRIINAPAQRVDRPQELVGGATLHRGSVPATGRHGTRCKPGRSSVQTGLGEPMKQGIGRNTGGPTRTAKP